MLDLLNLAAKYSLTKHRDKRAFYLGAVGVRNDGRIVHARNSPVHDTFTRDRWSKFHIYKRFPECHAEVRLTKKLGFGAVVYVARVARGTRELAMARPCESCQSVLRAFRVDKVYYTIDNNCYGVWYPYKEMDKIISC